MVLLVGYFAIPCEVVTGSCVRLGITKHLSNVQLGFLRGVKKWGETGQQEGLLSSHCNVSKSPKVSNAQFIGTNRHLSVTSICSNSC